MSELTSSGNTWSKETAREPGWLLCKLQYCRDGGLGACDWPETEHTEAHWRGKGEAQCVPAGPQCQGAPSTELGWQTYSRWCCQSPTERRHEGNAKRVNVAALHTALLSGLAAWQICVFLSSYYGTMREEPHKKTNILLSYFILYAVIGPETVMYESHSHIHLSVIRTTSAVHLFTYY